MSRSTDIVVSDGAGGPAPTRQGVVGAGGWAVSARASAQLAQLVLFIVAARVLTPADFGLFALVQASSVLLFVIAAAGWREFIMGWGGEPKAVNQAITLSFLSGYLMAGVGMAAGYIAAVQFDAPSVAILLALFSLCVLLSPLTNSYGAILVRRGHLRAMSLAGIVSELVGLGVGVAGLMEGWGILALAASKLATQTLNLVGVMLAARWPTRLILRGGFGAKIVEISRQILATRIIGFVSANAATFIVGSFLGVYSVGLFRAAERIVSSISELVFEPLRLIGWMIFRNAADKAKSEDGARHELTREAGFFLPLLVIFASPVFVGLAVVAEDLIVVLLGETWRDAAPVASILAVAALAMIPTVATEPLLTMTGKIKRLPPVSFLNAVVAVAVLLAFVQFGLIAAAFARFIAGFVAMATAVWLQARYARAPWRQTIKQAAPVYTALIALVAAVYGARLVFQSYGLSTTYQLAIDIGVGAFVYFAVIFLIRPSYLRSSVGM